MALEKVMILKVAIIKKDGQSQVGEDMEKLENLYLAYRNIMLCVILCKIVW